MKDQYTNATGILPVSELHDIYWEDWGNPKVKEPFFYLHGGPGSGYKNKHKSLFDPKKHRVVFHHQRGSGKSTPLGMTKQNTTQDLISDIEYIRELLKIKKIHLFGGSWGSTLALAYALDYPKRVKSMVLHGIFLSRAVDDDYHYGGYSSQHAYPEVWERFMKYVPKKQRSDAASIIDYYHTAMRTGTVAEQQEAAFEWTLFEASLLGVELDSQGLELALRESIENTHMFAQLESHYFKNNCFMPKNHIMNNISDINHIPTIIVHGRQDAICAPSAAFDLSAAMKQSKLYIVSGGHKIDTGNTGIVLKTLLADIDL